ncbi:MAG TPA: HAD-IA family hydrolase [Armatimonadota bacterium]|nr:HAD-IA family hydrolase [Armatimonadota bacterium]
MSDSGTDQYASIATEAGEALVRRASVASFAELDGIIFDMDGVLIDVGESVELVHGAAAEMYFAALGWVNCKNLVEPTDVDAFKLAGGFNSDWELAYAWFLLYLFKSVRCGSTDGARLKPAHPTMEEFTGDLARRGGGLASAVGALREMCSPGEWGAVEARWDRPGLQRMFVELYAGDLCTEIYGFEPKIVTGPGLIRRDKPILDRRFLPASMKLGIATGRTAGETTVGLRLMGWSGLFPPGAIVSEDDGFRKPDPSILRLAVQRLGAERPMYVGDTPDDLLTVRGYNETHGGLLCCIALTGPARSDSAGKARFAEQQADMIADNVNAALAAVERCSGGALCQAEKQR